MEKGVKSIRQARGKYFTNLSKGNFLVLEADSECSFIVSEWLKDTTDKDKNSLVWLLEDAQRTDILLERRVQVLNKLAIPRAKCGSVPMFYLEASLTNKINKNAKSGYLIRGQCPSVVKQAVWSATKGGPRLGETSLSYGDNVYLAITTEGLNGHELLIEVYQRKGMMQDDKIVRRIRTKCVNGKVDILIANTYAWYATMKNGPAKAELYIKVKDTISGNYILDDHKDDAHARFLRMDNKVVNRAVAPPSNVTIVKTGDKLPNLKREDQCRFTQIEVTDGADRVILFDEGKIKLKGATSKEFFMDEKLHYDFGKYTLKPQAKAILDKMAALLMEMPFIPVELGSHTDRFGTDAFNKDLSEKRAKAAMDYLISKNVAASRITSKGYGKTMLADKNPELSREDSEVNRRTTLRLRIFSHDAQSLVFETVKPGISLKKQLPIKIHDYHTKGLCNFISNKHTTDIPYSAITPSNKKDSLALEGDTIKPWIYGPMDNMVTGFDYIFPHLRSPNSFFFYINSCRYFSDKEKPSLIIKVYSDIKWEFAFFLDMSSPLNVGWKGGENMTPSRLEELRKSAAKLGMAHYNQTTEIDFGVKLSSSWNKDGDNYTKKEEYTKKFSKEIKALYSVISSVKEATRGLTAGTGGAPREKKFGTTTAMTIKILAPKFALGVKWQLARGSKKRVKTAEIGTEYKIFFHAEPLIGMDLTIDLLNLAITAASAAAGNPMAADIFIMIKNWAAKGYKSKRAEFSFDMYIDFVLKGTIEGGLNDITINTASDQLEVAADLSLKITGTLKAGVSLKAKAVLIEAGPNETDVHASATVSADLTVGITAKHMFKYDSNEGLIYKPGLVVDPCVGNVVVMIDVGISYRKISADWTPVNESGTREFWEGFDIMEKLSAVSGVSPSITLISKKS
ncbi:OmpA family protein [Pedobacter westerhofensis]|uniref:OmpA family protein n=1 Tax=Pedobacter westerhofensis TaxID=425512 RepID=A0A521BHK7_9SPHI|nr:OmpA family protein [Pedobacter westerhofensis]SMO46401.1 OmpA family protein [Pedobacter westerhofensis]